jgi:hypothetical protein
MRIRLSLIGVGVLMCARILSAGISTSAQSPAPEQQSTAPAPQSPAPQQDSTAPASGQDAKVPKDTCLGCHGPFDKITDPPDKYVAPSGEKTTPHRYVPHDSKKDEDIPECTNCHTAHSLDSLPEQGSIDLSKVDVQSCYKACHHDNSLTTCKSCH